MKEPYTLTLLIGAILFSTYYIAFKFDEIKVSKYDSNLFTSRHIIANKEHFSKMEVQKAQQFLDLHHEKNN